MPAAVSHRRAGLPTARLVLALALILGAPAPARAVLLPPPWRLAIVFDREVWAPAAPVVRAVPMRPGMDPVTFEERANG
jgi:hypothetical protein